MTKNPKINLTDEQLDHLVDALAEGEFDVEELLAEPDADEDSDVLSDDDAVSYALDALHGRDFQRVETLLASSPEAREEMAWLRKEAEAWKGPTGEQRVRTMARSIVWRAMPLTMVLGRLRQAAARGFDKLALDLQANFALKPVVLAGEIVAQGETPDGLVRWEIVRGEGDSLTVRLSSWATSLNGTTVRLQAGTWMAEAVLAPFGPGEVGAEVTIPADERRKAGAVPPVVSLTIVEGPRDTSRE